MLSRRVAGIAGALALSGCSYLNMDRPPKAVRRSDVFPGCTTENTYPYADIGLTVLAVVGAGLIYAGYARADDENDPTMKRELSTDERVVMGTFALLEGGVFALSARWGFEQSARCRELQAKLAAEPQPYPVQPYPVQPYPAQPYPAQPYPPPQQQPYPAGPAQPYPPPQQQPYPAGPAQPYPPPQQQPYPAGPAQPYPAPPPAAAPPQPYPAPPAPPQQKKPGGAS